MELGQRWLRCTWGVVICLWTCPMLLHAECEERRMQGSSSRSMPSLCLTTEGCVGTVGRTCEGFSIRRRARCKSESAHEAQGYRSPVGGLEGSGILGSLA